MKRVAAIAGTMLAALSLAAAGCGGDADEPLSETARQVAAICDTWAGEVVGRPFPVENFDPQRPSPADLPAVGEHFAPAVAAQERAVAALRKLTPPSQEAATVSALIAAVDRQGAVARTQVAAARAADVDAFVATLDDVDASQVEVEKAATALGVQENCAF